MPKILSASAVDASNAILVVKIPGSFIPPLYYTLSLNEEASTSRCPSADGTFATEQETTCTLSDLKTATTYEVTVTAIDGMGRSSSASLPKTFITPSRLRMPLTAVHAGNVGLTSGMRAAQ
jgi:hypothetical protein